MSRHGLRRTASVLVALVGQEVQTVAQYRWWLAAMQVGGVVAPLVTLLAWRGAIAHGATPPVTAAYLTTYLVLVSLVTMLTSSWTAPFLASSIRLGGLSSWLVRPCSTHVAAVANNIAEKVVKLVVLLPFVAALAVVFRRELELPADPSRWCLFLWALVMGAVVAFSVDVVVGSLAFWWEDISAVNRVRQLVSLFLSGAVVPLSVMPAAWRPVLDAQPFAYVVAFPVQTLLATESSSLLHGLAAQAAWAVLAVASARLVWVRGLRRYSGAGA